MITLAIELSTESGSLALLENNRVRLERTWREDRSQRQQVFAEIEAAMAEGGMDPAQVELFAVGVGPGAFSGLRMAVSAVRAMAMPDGRPVYAVSSAAALAWEIMLETGGTRVVVAGDARRGEWWLGRFQRGDEGLRQEGGWAVAGEAQHRGLAVEPGTVWVTPDWDRIGEGIKAACPAGASWVCERRIPKARYVGLVAAARFRDGVASEELAPIYLHPAVGVPPVI
ncbi:MAG: tRNA (adenosine(37)-N6)-threonylcarbamoyltransferase complex dimerization subunit type 1 TsaB [bacterium]